MRLWPHWRSILIIFKPETVIAWHRKGFRLSWTWKYLHDKSMRPRIPKDVRERIRTMSENNATCGAPRIHGELLKHRNQRLPGNRRWVHGPASKTALSNMARISRKPLGGGFTL
jgi:hypothetical protein